MYARLGFGWNNYVVWIAYRKLVVRLLLAFTSLLMISSWGNEYSASSDTSLLFILLHISSIAFSSYNLEQL